MQKQRGFTYLAVLMAITLLGLGLAAAGTTWTLQSRRDREQDLLDAGRTLRTALVRYYKASPTPPYQYPKKLEDLLLDERYQFTRRHLRRIPVDPFTRNANWGLITLPDGQIIGVHSLAENEPIKRSGFMKEEADFAKAGSYRDWKFTPPPNP